MIQVMQPALVVGPSGLQPIGSKAIAAQKALIAMVFRGFTIRYRRGTDVMSRILSGDAFKSRLP